LLLLLPREFVDSWLDFMSEKVNPCNLVCGHTFFEEVAKLGAVADSDKFPLIMMNLSTEVYDPSKVKAGERPIPDTAQFIMSTDVEALCRDPARLKMVEAFMRDLRQAVQPLLSKAFENDTKTQRAILRLFEGNVVRVLAHKTQFKGDRFFIILANTC
jgi:hypothetical protein